MLIPFVCIHAETTKQWFVTFQKNASGDYHWIIATLDQDTAEKTVQYFNDMLTPPPPVQNASNTWELFPTKILSEFSFNVSNFFNTSMRECNEGDLWWVRKEIDKTIDLLHYTMHAKDEMMYIWYCDHCDEQRQNLKDQYEAKLIKLYSLFNRSEEERNQSCILAFAETRSYDDEIHTLTRYIENESTIKFIDLLKRIGLLMIAFGLVYCTCELYNRLGPRVSVVKEDKKD
jgi:hypothetical protein